MKRLIACGMLLLAGGAGQVRASAIAEPSVYAVNAAALASAMTYCATRHDNLTQGSPGAECFAKARRMLAELKLATWSGAIDRKCTDDTTYNQCITPEIGRLVFSLNDAFKSRGL